MKKYNLSKIMRRAWELVKTTGMTISSGLKKAWEEAKAVKEKFEKSVKILKEGSFGESDSDYLTFKLWEKYGKRRAYINDYKGRTIGYLEGNSYKEYDTHGNYSKVIETAIAVFRKKYEF